MIPTVDSHQHFWERSRGDYDWLTADKGPIFDDFRPDDLRPDLASCQIDQTILVQAAENIEETRYLLSLAEETDFITGVVGWVDMEAKHSADDISALAEHPKFKGIRPMIQDIGDPDWMLNPDLSPAFDAIIEKGLTFDALVRPRHLENLLTLLKRYPDLRVVVNHAAKPPIASGDVGHWSDAISEIANATNAYCKFSGLVTEAGENMSGESIGPYFEHIYHAFGARRLMWGSDWPVVKLRMEYVDWHSIAMSMVATVSEQDQRSIMGQTAADFYSLPFQR